MSSTSHEDPRLFDLPLAPAAAGDGGHREAEAVERHARRRPAARSESLPLFDGDEPADETEVGGGEVATPRLRDSEPPAPRAARSRPMPLPRPAAAPPTAPLAPRLRAAAGDLAVLAAVTVLASAGASALEVEVGVRELPGVGLFLLAWSFLYFVVSLAFWGQTPGMVWAGVVARSGVDEPLSFGQTARRWAGTWLTWLAAGLPGLLALGGRSFADRISGSSTYELDAAPPLA